MSVVKKKNFLRRDLLIKFAAQATRRARCLSSAVGVVGAALKGVRFSSLCSTKNTNHTRGIPRLASARDLNIIPIVTGIKTVSLSLPALLYGVPGFGGDARAAL